MTAPDRIQITHQDPMITPNFRALCAELLQAWQFGGDIAGPMNRARAALKAKPEGEGPVSERLRIVRAGIRAGYNLGHHHTVEGGWGDPDEVADDIAQETLDDIGLPPAPQCLIARMADELDRLQPLPAFPPITSHPLAIEARALLRDGIATIPDPQDGEAGEPVPVAELDDQHREAPHPSTLTPDPQC